MSATVRAGERFADFSYSKPPPDALLTNGFTGFIGYVSVPPSNPDKNISKEQCRGYLDAGLNGGLVWEMSAASSTFGARVGATHGRQAADEVHARGLPEDVPIMVADDCGTTTANIGPKQDYMQAFNGNSGWPAGIGIYGGVKTLVRCQGLWRIGWVPTSAWSWSVSLARLPKETLADYNIRGRAAAETAAHDVGAHVLQRSSYLLDGVWSIDPNDVIADFPAWGAASQPTPPVSEDDMATVFFAVEGMPGQYMWTPGTAPIPFTNPTDRDQLLKGLGIDPATGVTISLEMFNRLTPEHIAAAGSDALARQGVLDMQDDFKTLKGKLRDAGSG